MSERFANNGYIRNDQGIELFVSYLKGNNQTYWVFCNSLMEESIFLRPFYQELALFLNQQGNHVIQFDYAGCGESCGDFSRVNFSSMKDDINSVIKSIREPSSKEKNIILFGMRIGANLALSVSSESNYSCLCWLPVTDGKRFCSDLLYANMAVQLSNFNRVRTNKKQLLECLHQGKGINVLGYQIKRPLFSAFESISIHSFEEIKENQHVYINISPANKQIISLIKDKKIKAKTVPINPFWHEPNYYPESQTELLDSVGRIASGEEALNL